MERSETVFKELCKELEDNKSVHTKRISEDEIKTSVATLFENSTGVAFSTEKLEELIQDGEERYKHKIPPGFKDGSKFKESEVFSGKCRKFGDLFVWFQVIDKSIETGKDIVFVTDDKKEDWWEKFKGKTVGPRPELVKEFVDKTNNSFHMYQADRFLELARENLNEEVSPEIVEEIREVRKRNVYENMKNRIKHNRLKRKEELNLLFEEIENTRSHTIALAKRRNMIQEKQHTIQQQREQLKEHRELFSADSGEDIEIEQLSHHYSAMTEEERMLQKDLAVSSHQYDNLQRKLIALEQDVANRMEMFDQEDFIKISKR